MIIKMFILVLAVILIEGGVNIKGDAIIPFMTVIVAKFINTYERMMDGMLG